MLKIAKHANTRLFFVTLSLILIPPSLLSEYLEDLESIKVIDGDTIHAEQKGNLYKIRLLEIDAPEMDQTNGPESKAFLSQLLRDGYVDAEITGKDRYGRYLARLYLDGEDINRHMVKAGFAWVYDDYVTDKSFYVDQKSAKRNKLGLWRADNPLPPWDWRSKQRYKSFLQNNQTSSDNSQNNSRPIQCCKICKKGKACGNSCISASYKCTKLKGCACNG